MNLLFTAPNRRETIDSETGKMHSIELTEDVVANMPVTFEELIHAVYYQITSLDFLDSDSPTNAINLEEPKLNDIKEFCKTLVDRYQNK